MKGQTNTFESPGVTEHALFMKHVSDARALRKSLLNRLETASLPAHLEKTPWHYFMWQSLVVDLQVNSQLRYILSIHQTDSSTRHRDHLRTIRPRAARAQTPLPRRRASTTHHSLRRSATHPRCIRQETLRIRNRTHAQARRARGAKNPD